MSWLFTYTFIGAQGTVGVGMLEDSPSFTETKAKERWKNGTPSCFLCRREKKKDKHMYAVRVSLHIHVLRTNSWISYSQETPASLIVSLLVSGSVWRGNSISYMLDSFFFFLLRPYHIQAFLFPFLWQRKCRMMRKSCLTSLDYFCIMKPFQWSSELQYALGS